MFLHKLRRCPFCATLPCGVLSSVSRNPDSFNLQILSLHLSKTAAPGFNSVLTCPERTDKCPQEKGQKDVTELCALGCFPYSKDCVLPVSVCFCLISGIFKLLFLIFNSLWLLLAGDLVQKQQLYHGLKQIFQMLSQSAGVESMASRSDIVKLRKSTFSTVATE